jgi:hypothetical protein
VTFLTPTDLLHRCADCIDEGDEIGRLLYMRAHDAKLQIPAPVAAPAVALKTVLPSDLSRPFSARFKGECLVSGRTVWPGDEVYKTAGGVILVQVVREWGFTRNDGAESSNFVRGLDVAAVEAALLAGARVTVLNGSFERRYYRLDGAKVIALDATGAPARMGTNGSNFKTIGAWWNATASKAQALRVEIR